ncbi:MAG TPA: hypothetical protein VGQ36_27615 [Thermoanaerobaculia bacterium]|jgi:hypothetical protein|nr:hypothetical protein [Thermoanaerobaculia bacterium]
MTRAKPVVREVKSKVPVSELNLKKAAARLLTSKLVSTEVVYIQRTLGASATQEDLDAKVLAVRAMPWSSIVVPD